MENSLEEYQKSSKKVEYVFHKKFEELCPFFMSIGMTYEEFWQGETILTRYYLKAFKLKEKREAEKTKWTIWEQGMYIYGALCYVSPILHAFSKARKPLPYPEKPWGIEKFEEKEQKKTTARKEREQQVQVARAQIFFTNWARQVQKKFEKKGEANE